MKVEIREFDTKVPSKRPAAVRERRAKGGSVWTVEASSDELARSMLYVFNKSVKKALKKASTKHAAKRTPKR